MPITLTMPVLELADRLLSPGAACSDPARLEDWDRIAGFLRLAGGEGFDLSDATVVLDDRRRVCWAAVAVRSPGRTSLLVLGPLPGGPAGNSPPGGPAVAAALGGLVEQEMAHGCGLVQALLPPEQTAEARLLGECGFDRLAELIYLQAPLPGSLLDAASPRDAWPAQPGDGAHPYAPADEPTFARVIAASYVHTRDCPALEGVRPMDDVMAGHRASGIFRPDLWFLFTRDDEPIGAVLLNEVQDRRGGSVELVYMGLVESARGQGLGRRMFHYAMRAARQAGYRRILTAVDAQNTPALRLYLGMGFSETMRRLAYIRPAARRVTASERRRAQPFADGD